GLLLCERQVRQRARRAIAEQTEYDQLIAELTVHTAHADAHDEMHGGLDGAVARLGRYAGASEAILDQYGHGPNDPPLRIKWPSGTTEERRDRPLEISLVVDETAI